MKTPRLSPWLFGAALLAAGCSDDVTTGAGDQKDRRESLHEGRDEGDLGGSTDDAAAVSSGTADNSAAVGSGIDAAGGGDTGVTDPAEAPAPTATSDNPTTEDAAGTDPGDN